MTNQGEGASSQVPGPSPASMKVPNAGRRRRVGLWAYSCLVVMLLAGTGVGAGLPWSANASFSNRLVEVTNALGFGTLLLAGVGGLIALRAYAAATGLPGILVRVRIGSNLNQAMISGEDHGDLITIASYPIMEITLWNRNGFSARNPAVSVRLEGMLRVRGRAGPSADWADVEFLGQDIAGMQWDGGPTYSVHGYSTRRLPDLHLTGLEHHRPMGQPKIDIVVLADGGYRYPVEIPVDLIVDGNSLYPQQVRRPHPEWI